MKFEEENVTNAEQIAEQDENTCESLAEDIMKMSMPDIFDEMSSFVPYYDVLLKLQSGDNVQIKEVTRYRSSYDLNDLRTKIKNLSEILNSVNKDIESIRFLDYNYISDYSLDDAISNFNSFISNTDNKQYSNIKKDQEVTKEQAEFLGNSSYFLVYPGIAFNLSFNDNSPLKKWIELHKEIDNEHITINYVSTKTYESHFTANNVSRAKTLSDEIKNSISDFGKTKTLIADLKKAKADEIGKWDKNFDSLMEASSRCKVQMQEFYGVYDYWKNFGTSMDPYVANNYRTHNLAKAYYDFYMGEYNKIPMNDISSDLSVECSFTDFLGYKFDFNEENNVLCYTSNETDIVLSDELKDSMDKEISEVKAVVDACSKVKI